MRQRRPAWILLPAAIVILAVVAFVVSNYQKEVGIAAPGKGGVAAVAAAAEARSAALGTGSVDYEAFSNSLVVAIVEARNMATTNPAEARLQVDLRKTLDCLSALREAWQAELDQAWDPATDGSPAYWRTVHPALTEQTAGPLSAQQVREWSSACADHWLQKAVGLAE
jgi:hypothetical protein